MNQKTLKEVTEELDSMSREELLAIVEKLSGGKEECNPETCTGQCQGMGSCEMCVDFRKSHKITFKSIL